MRSAKRLCGTRRAAANSVHPDENRSVACLVRQQLIDTIRRWAEKRGAVPASVEGTEHGREQVGILRFEFRPTPAKLEPIDWDAFFEKFEESELAFIHRGVVGGCTRTASTKRPPNGGLLFWI